VGSQARSRNCAGELAAERTDYEKVVLERRRRDALARLNPELPSEALKDAYRRITRPEGATLEARNRAFHRNGRRDGGVAQA